MNNLAATIKLVVNKRYLIERHVVAKGNKPHGKLHDSFEVSSWGGGGGS